MGIISPIMSFIVDRESGFPAPSEREKINKALEKYRSILKKFPQRADSGEIKFGMADLLVGRNDPGDYGKALSLYEDILKTSSSPYLRARAQVGKAELLVPGIKKEAIADALAICDTARKNLGKAEISDFFVAKTFIVEADLRLVRDEAGDHKKALGIHEKLAKNRKTHWYFRARAQLGKAELILYHYPAKLTEGITLCEKAANLLRERKGDYFNQKTKLIESELLLRRGKKEDFKNAETLLKQLVEEAHPYKDLLARGRLDLAEISRTPAARKYLKEVEEMEGLDPYILDKVRLVESKLSSKK
ncbi:MAG: hypothetical protein WC645_04885 [Candidatus Margulisiibacteriota bacterium]